jgi:hypothetical protein
MMNISAIAFAALAYRGNTFDVRGQEWNDTLFRLGLNYGIAGYGLVVYGAAAHLLELSFLSKPPQNKHHRYLV